VYSVLGKCLACRLDVSPERSEVRAAECGSTLADEPSRFVVVGQASASMKEDIDNDNENRRCSPDKRKLDDREG
jgi:hypothetical protein